MNKEQNIEDILKQLKNSYEGDGVAENSAELSSDSDNAISHEELKQKLRNQFMDSSEGNNTSSDYQSDSFSYDIDNDFLSEASGDIEDDTNNEEDLPPFDMPESDETEENMTEELFEDENDEEDDDISIFDDEEDDDVEDAIFVEDENGELVLVHAQEDDSNDYEPDIEIEKSEAEDSFDLSEIVADEQETVMEDTSEENMSEDFTPESLQTEEDSEVDEQMFFSEEDGQLALFEDVSSDYVTELARDFSETPGDDENQMVMDFGDTDLFADLGAEREDISEIDDSMLGIMLEVGDISAAQDHITAERVDEYINKTKQEKAEAIDPSEAFAFDGEEFETADQTEQIYESYRHEKLFTILRFIGCAFFTLFLLIYELLPILEVNMGLLTSYDKYPVVYTLIGMQILMLSVVLSWRELWGGLKRVFSLKANRWSAISFVTLFVLIYDIAIVIISPDKVSFMFGTLASAYITIALLAEYLEVVRQSKCFEIYSSTKKKFTFNTDAGLGSAAEKMYRGGVTYDKKVFEPREIDFPKGYFSAVNTTSDNDGPIIYMITPTVLLSAVAFIVSAMLQNPIEISMAMFMVTLSALCPLSAFAVKTIPFFKASERLYTRDVAVACEDMVSKYAECDYIVFSDMHLFKKATSQDNGIVILDEKNTRTVIEYLDLIYSEIGGPMRDVFGGVSRGKHTIKLRRIARNGVEAVVDSTRSIILGDAAFTVRYGIPFEQGESAEGDGILLFAIDGRPSAKLCLRYKCEPLFEMLLARMYENGVQCAIETYDPVINSAFTAYRRRNKNIPINVIHKNAIDFYSSKQSDPIENTGMVVASSRFKLIEGVVWCKRLAKIFKILRIAQWVTFGVVSLLLAVLFGIGATALNQYIALLVQLVAVVPVFATMGMYLPKRDYFSAESMQRVFATTIRPTENKETEKNK